MKFRTLLIILTLVPLASCSDNTKSETIITAEEFKDLHTKKENDNKRLAIVGYPAVTSDLTITSDNKGNISIFSEPDGQGKYIGHLRVSMGSGNNKMWVPDNFTNQDLKVYDNEGNELTTNDKIHASFTVDLDTNRDPFTSSSTKEINGKWEKVETTQYYGNGPIDIRIDKAE